jgi:predicted enzyme related to lactoylglutathione lyase
LRPEQQFAHHQQRPALPHHVQGASDPGWEFATGGPAAEPVSRQGEYGFTEPAKPGIPGGVGGGSGQHPHTVFYVGVPEVEAALEKAESLGGKRMMGPERVPGQDLVVGHFTDPEGNLIGLAGPA